MKKLIFSLLFMLSISAHLSSQNASDALRYSRIFYNGTARFMGMGGAFGALGADYSVTATNPAGIGLYKSSEITATPSFSFNPSSSDYNGETGSDTQFNFAMGNFGFVFTIKPQNKNKSGGLKSFNIGFGMNRQNDYNTGIFMQGINNKNSKMTEYTSILNNQPHLTYDQIDQKYPFDIALATNANLIYFNDSTNTFRCDAPNGGVYQQKSVITSGSINEFNFSFGANLNDEWYFGATIGIPYIRYYESDQYQEYDINDTISYFRSLTFNQMIETHGTGVNFKAGVIYRPANWVRIGASVHTPTYYGFMNDNWSSSMFASFDSVVKSTPQYSPLGYYDYQMATPFRAIGSLAFIIGQFGLISAEYEFVNYNQARFYSNEGSSVFSGVNEEIKSSYRAPVNIRFGTEWKIQNLYFRGGFGYYGEPYHSGINTGKKYVASGGFGYRGRHLFADISYVWSQTNEEYYFYDPKLVNPSNNTLTSNTILTTFGVRF